MTNNESQNESQMKRRSLATERRRLANSILELIATDPTFRDGLLKDSDAALKRAGLGNQLDALEAAAAAAGCDVDCSKTCGYRSCESSCLSSCRAQTARLFFLEGVHIADQFYAVAD
jgi:hypothetical protein